MRPSYIDLPAGTVSSAASYHKKFSWKTSESGVGGGFGGSLSNWNEMSFTSIDEVDSTFYLTFVPKEFAE